MRNTILTSLAMAGLAFGQADASLLPQDYKCGISMRYSGTSGVDYLREDHFHEPLQNNRSTVYIKAATTISMYHNELNTMAKAPVSASVNGKGNGNVWVGASGPDRILGNLDDGVIRWRMDGDFNEKMVIGFPIPKPTNATWNTMVRFTEYTAPIAFSAMQYPGGLSVVGRTGNNGQPITNPDTYYHYGILDSAGDEWHSLCIGDDDFGYADPLGYKEVESGSDGKMQMFVVNPITPCITVAETGNAQFYTTPAKIYFVPVIHPQTTYIMPRAGTVTVTLTDIYGGVVQYRINGGSWTNNGTNTVALADSAFTNGTNTLETRYAATPAVIRSRTIVKNPAFPSAGEAHGNVMWGDTTEYAAIMGRLPTGRYASYWTKLKTQRTELYHNYWDDYGMQGHRRPWYGLQPTVSTKAFANAFVAKALGWDAKISVDAPKTFANYAKEMLLDNTLNLDNVSLELNSNWYPAPGVENRGAGYYIVNNVFQFAAGYDMMIGSYRSDQHADGITPIEDYFIRDQMAGWSLRVMKNFAKNGPGLWTTAMASGSFLIGLVMPDYDTSYLGTSGYNGTTLATHPWTPYPDYPVSWKTMWTDLTPAGHTYPNQEWVHGPDRDDPGYDLLVDSGPLLGFWEGYNEGYYNVMRTQWFVTTNLSAIHTPSRTWPVIHQAYLYSVLGQQAGNSGAGSPSTAYPVPPYEKFYQQMLPAINDRHPTVVGPGRQALIDRGAAVVDDLFTLIWYDDGAGAASVLPVTFSPGAGTYNVAQSVALASATGGATIRYTTNGTVPTTTTGTVYSSPIAVAATTTIKAIAYNGVISPSGVSTAAITIDGDVVIIPPPATTPARLQGGIKAGKDAARLGN